MRIPPFQTRHTFHRAVGGQVGCESHEQFLAEIGVGNLTPAELDHRLDAVALLEEPDGVVLFVPETEVYYGMNAVAASVWELLPQASDSMDRLCSLIHERFPDAQIEIHG